MSSAVLSGHAFGLLRMPADARLMQAATLSVLLAVNVSVLDLGASWAQAAVTLGAALGTQAVLRRRAGLTGIDWPSPLITGLSLSILLRSQDPAVWLCAGAAGVGSKFLLRVGGKQVFNPACFAIAALLLSGRAWVSPGQWGALAWTGLLLAGAAGLVLHRAARADTAVAFLGTYAGLLALRAAWLGDPWAIPLHQAQSGALLVFAFFMITDPRSTPDARAGRIVFAIVVAGLAHALQFGWQVREGLFYALVLAAPLTPVLDRLIPARRFRWAAPTAAETTS